MENIELWRGQSKNLTISNLQADTLKNGHISKYVFDSDNLGNTELNGCGQLENAKTTITAITSVNQSKQYNISAYLLYSHNFPGSETTATSNIDVTNLTVKEPLDATSLTGLQINGENWVWSNAESKEFSITPSFATKNPYSKIGEYVTNATVQNSSIGYVTTIPSGAADITTIKLRWNKSTGNSTDLGSKEKSINVNVKSIEESAPTATIISAHSATLTVRNAVTELRGLSNAEIYARATTQISQVVTFTPENPYNKALKLVGEDDQQISGNSISIDGAVLQLSNENQTVTLNASDAINTVDKSFKFKIRSIQGAHNVDTDLITFTVKAVADITGKEVVEGQTITIDDVHIGNIESAEVLSGPVRATFTGASVSITGTAVDDDTDWSVKVSNATGAHITISGTTKYLADVSVNINTGDYIIIGTDTLKGLTTPFEIVHDTEHPIVGTAAIADNVLRYDASTTDGHIAAGTYPIKVKGANGATQTVNVVVSDINTTPSEPDYLCFTSTGDSTVAMKQNGIPKMSANKVIQYKLNDGQWQNWDLSAVSLADGDKMYLKSDDNIPISESNNKYKNLKMTGSIAASGNIMSLLNFSTTLTDNTFINLFKQCNVLTQAPALPATTLAESCYNSMFYNCTSLTQAPALPATTLANYCYSYMFYNCTSLTQAPELHATTLAESCYNSMFYNCTSLTQAPALPATTLASDCYSSMFNGCTSLAQAPALPATTLTSDCYSSMFSGCKSLTQAPALPATTLAESCYNRMFNGCKSLTQAPELPATTLANICYNTMFNGCSSLTQAPALPATTLAESCYNSMFNGCASLTQAPELPATTLANNCYYGMFSGCSSLTQAPELPATTLANYCYSSMFNGCASLTQAPALPATTLAESCYQFMFQGCSSLVQAPELPATTLANNCYDRMFSSCSKLNYIKAMFTTTPNTKYTYNWVSGVSSTGTFVKNASATWNVTGANGIPTGWTVETV